MAQQEKFMKKALDEAKKGYAENEVPVGAVLVYQDKIIARAHNKREKNKDATAHAEILCIKKACKKLGDFRLLDADLYVSLEPCTMCLGAALNARIRTIYIGANTNKDAISCEELVERAQLNHKCKIVRGVLIDECSQLISQYFLEKRRG